MVLFMLANFLPLVLIKKKEILGKCYWVINQQYAKYFLENTPSSKIAVCYEIWNFFLNKFKGKLKNFNKTL